MSTPNVETPQDGGGMNTRAKSVDLVGELFKLMPATSGIMLALIWGLANRTKPPHSVLIPIRIASIILAVSIFLSLLGLQFMVSELQNDNPDVSRASTVQVCFIGAWVAFIVGSAAVIWSLFLI
jgi:hypothetical protein